jgi:signal transduction histidine kinase/ActR/RegA family two-component response regulator
MGTQRKILLALIGFVFIAILLSVIISHINTNREQLIIAYNLEQLEHRSKAVVEDQELQVHQIIDDYTYWDDFVGFVNNPDNKWAQENIATMITSFDFVNVTIFDLRGKKLFSASDSSSIPTVSIEIDKEMLPELYAKRFISYYQFTESGLLMIQGATIHLTKDPEKLTDPSGYFFVAKRWDAALIQEIEKISGCRIANTEIKPLFKPETFSDSISSVYVLKNWIKEDVGYIVFTSDLNLITLLRRISIQKGLLLTFSAIGFLIALTFLLSTLVTRPLRLVSEIVENEDLTKIPLLKKNSRDFERIGLLIEQFVNQKKELVHAMHLARASDMIKTDFLNNISHEVRTPLNGILGASALLSDPDLTPDVREEMTDIMNESTRRLMRTITQYMDISLLSSDNMPYYPVETDLFHLLKPILEDYSKACRQKHLNWIVDFPSGYSNIKLLIDKSLLEKVLDHLLHNAIKFTDKGSVKFGFVLGQSTIEFFVKDSGVGIEKKVQPMIFKNFTQEDFSSLRRYEGSGLGLAICRKAMQLLGGNIWFDSEKGQGTSFYLTVPYDDTLVHSNTKEANIKFKDPAQKSLVLIAEDDDSNFLVLETIIRKHFNIDVIRAYNGLDAVDYCKSNPIPDLVLMDIKMPVMDGFEATSIIKMQFPNLPIIAVTAYGLSGDEFKSIESGCDDYISKPINTKILLSKFERYLTYLDPKK